MRRGLALTSRVRMHLLSGDDNLPRDFTLTGAEQGLGHGSVLNSPLAIPIGVIFPAPAQVASEPLQLLPHQGPVRNLESQPHLHALNPNLYLQPQLQPGQGKFHLINVKCSSKRASQVLHKFSWINWRDCALSSTGTPTRNVSSTQLPNTTDAGQKKCKNSDFLVTFLKIEFENGLENGVRVINIIPCSTNEIMDVKALLKLWALKAKH